jgi:hypothetical protein
MNKNNHYTDEINNTYCLIKIIDNIAINKFYHDELDRNILEICYNNLQTMKEIFEKYKYKSKRNRNTVYKIMQQMINQNLLIEGGQRSFENQLVKVMLYQISAQFFLYEQYLNFSITKSFVDTIKIMIQEYLGVNDSFFDNLDEYIKEIAVSPKNYYDQLLDNEIIYKKRVQKYFSQEYFIHSEKIFGFNVLFWLFSVIFANENLKNKIIQHRNDFSFQPNKKKQALKYKSKKGVIIEKTPNLVKSYFPYNDKTLKELKYSAIISLLEKEPLTVTEIAEKHLSEMVEINNRKEIKSKVSTYSQSSIYRLIQDLVKEDIILEIGSRKVPQTSKKSKNTPILKNQKLFGLTAEFLVFNIELFKLCTRNDIEMLLEINFNLFDIEKSINYSKSNFIEDFTQKIQKVDQNFVNLLNSIHSELFLEEIRKLYPYQTEIAFLITKILLLIFNL